MSPAILSASAILALLVAACGIDGGSEPEGTNQDATEATVTIGPTTTSGDPAPPLPANDLLPIQELPDALSGVAQVWGTDFTKASVDLNEIKLGIPALDPRDLIRPIDTPDFLAVSEIDWLTDQDPGVALEVDGDARFYPLAVLTRHEIVNDTVGDVPIAVTYCPLCNTALAFDRRFDGQTLRFGVSGLLRHSDLVMWDDATESLWQQITGQGIVGTYAGEQLEIVGSSIVRWADFAANYPDGRALSSEQGFGIPYGANPYSGYSSRPRPFPFFEGEIDTRYPALSRVVGVTLESGSKAYPFAEISEAGAVNDAIGEMGVVVFWGASDTADALDASIISQSDGVGTGIAFSPLVNDRPLTFEKVDDTTFKDIETGTTWTLLGKAVEGELVGSQLTILPHRNEFWFAWDVFFPDSPVWTN